MAEAPDLREAPEAGRLTALVHGRVQAVGYRDFCVRTAGALSRAGGARLTGYARNLDGGSTVEVVAEGPHDLLAAFERRLRQGPRLAQVRRVESRWGAATREFERFWIRD